MLGSFHDAEDAVQETLLRAWRHLANFQARSSFRTWLYRIATNVCLTQGSRRRRDVPNLPQVIAEAVARSTEPAINLTPYPDMWLDELAAPTGDPVAEFDLRESVQLAFLAAVQLLPPRQRAVLLLRDVVGFSAGDVAELLDVTTASVNHALLRARATMEKQRSAGRLQKGRIAPADDIEGSLVDSYVEAWRAADIGQLAAVLKSDAVLTMPPLPLRLVGCWPVAEFMTTVPSGGARERRRIYLTPIRANRQPALAVYRLDPDERTYHATGIWVLTIDGDAIAEITAFFDATLLPAFGLPTELERDPAAI
jgi:RNA polymerase sigma-70 factor (ECF subfamily)